MKAANPSCGSRRCVNSSIVPNLSQIDFDLRLSMSNKSWEQAKKIRSDEPLIQFDNHFDGAERLKQPVFVINLAVVEFRFDLDHLA